MKLKLIKLRNFRQFRGEQQLEISSPRSSASSRGALTLVHGEMGHGKTTLLNAFRWCLNGSKGVSDRFTGPGDIINLHVFEFGDRPSAEVQLHFEHGDDAVELKRVITKVQQQSTEKDDHDGYLTLAVTSVVTGKTHIYEGQVAQNYVDSVIPLPVYDLLFFDGEGINKLATKGQNEKMGESVLTLLGLNHVRSAITALRAAMPALRKEDRDSSTGDEKKLKEERDSKDAELRDILDKKNQAIVERDAISEMVKAYSEDLKRKENARKLQEEREAVDASLSDAQKGYNHAEASLRSLIAEKGYVLFCTKLVTDGLEITKKLRSERKIPAPIMTDFIRELIEAQKCICGGCLVPGSPEHDSVARLLDVAKDAKFHDAAASLERTIGSISTAISRTRTEFSNLIDICVTKKAEISKLRVKKDKITVQLEELGDPDVDNIEKNKADAESKLKRFEWAVMSAERDAEKLEAVIADLDRRIKEALKRSSSNSYAAERVSVVEDAINDLDASLKTDLNRLAPDLQQMVNESFSKMVEISGQVRVTPEFIAKAKSADEIKIHVSLDTEVTDGVWREDNANTGKRQCLSLAFISSLVRYAQQRAEATTGYLAEVSGDIYPMVMDAPFANLDPAAKRRFAPQLGALATQVVAMLNSDHYDAEFEKGLETSPGIVGHRYVLVHHYRKLPPDGVRSICIQGVDHSIMQLDEGSTYEWSEIRKIS
ncbi:MAG: AAA family ATPase [Opitutales bacterium]|nr:AAA family ATPase [Opitutales bacterium]